MTKQNRQRLSLAGSAGLGAGVGAGLMYLLDPQGGRDRRAAAKSKAAVAVSKGGDAVKAVKKTSKQLGGRTKDLVSDAGTRLRRGAEVTDKLLRERVTSKLRYAVKRAADLAVDVREGRVTLSGPVLALEADRLLDAVRAVKGVKDVECRFDLHEREEDFPALSGLEDVEPARPLRSRLSGLKPASRTGRILAGTALGALGVSLIAGGVAKSGAGSKLADLARRARNGKADDSSDSAARPARPAGGTATGSALARPTSEADDLDPKPSLADAADDLRLQTVL